MSVQLPSPIPGGGGISSGENLVFQFVVEIFPAKFFVQFGVLPALCASSVAAVAQGHGAQTLLWGAGVGNCVLCAACPRAVCVTCPDVGGLLPVLGHRQHILDAVLYADNAPKSENAVDSRSAFGFLTPICVILLFTLF